MSPHRPGRRSPIGSPRLAYWSDPIRCSYHDRSIDPARLRRDERTTLQNQTTSKQTIPTVAGTFECGTSSGTYRSTRAPPPSRASQISLVGRLPRIARTATTTAATTINAMKKTVTPVENRSYQCCAAAALTLGSPPLSPTFRALSRVPPASLRTDRCGVLRARRRRPRRSGPQRGDT